MTEQHEPDIRRTWTLARGSHPQGIARFHLRAEVIAEFVEPTRDEIRTALMQTLDEALGPDLDLDKGVDEIAGWTNDEVDTALVNCFDADQTELQHLRAWKAEAMDILETLEECHDLLPAPYQAQLGDSKVEAVLHFIRHSEPIGVYDEEPPGSPDG